MEAGMGTEEEARTLGWVPQEEFKGSPDRWVDAEAFVERGRTIMPILKENNKKLEGEVERLRGETQRLQNLFADSQASIEDLKAFHKEATKEAVERARKELVAELRTARDEGDVEKEVELNEKLAGLKEREKDRRNGSPPTSPSPPELHPDFLEWAKDNTWFGKDQRKTLLAMGVAQELRADPENDGLVGRKFFDHVLEVMEERSGRGRAPARVASGGAAPQGGPGERAYVDLPSDAKAACDKQAKGRVGEGKAFKDVGAWRKYYADIYFQGE